MAWLLSDGYANIIAMKFYTLDRETMIDVQKTLNERKAAHEASQAE